MRSMDQEEKIESSPKRIKKWRGKAESRRERP
jgi:hypothetical protein